MKLSDFSVVNYRSITTARKIKTNNMTVLVENKTKLDKYMNDLYMISEIKSVERNIM